MEQDYVLIFGHTVPVCLAKIISMVDVLPVVTVHKEDIFQSRGNTAVLIVLQLGGQMLRWASEKIADPNLVTITSYSRMDETAWA